MAAGKEPAENCVICLDPISERAVASPCQHAFDYLCLLNWLEVRQSCPLCNAAISVLSVADKTLGRVVRHPINPPQTQTATTRPPRRRRRQQTPTPPPLPAPTALLRRRYIYTHRLRSRHIGSNRHSRFRSPPTPPHFRQNPDLVSRARTFIRRELSVFPWLADREFPLEYVVAILKSVDLRAASGAAEDMIADLLGRDNARVFVHELHAWLRSPFARLADFDRFAQYAQPVPGAFSPAEEAALLRAQRERDASPSPGGGKERTCDSYRPSYSRA